MKEYFVMFFVFTLSIVLFGWFFGALINAWLIVGRSVMLKRHIDIRNEGVFSYWFYLTWPYYLK